MPTKKEEFEKIIGIWNKLIEKQSPDLSKILNELEISSLSACIGDCFQSFQEIYYEQILRIEKSIDTDYNALHDSVADIYWAFGHIKNHIIDVDQGFTELMRLLAKKAEEKEKG